MNQLIEELKVFTIDNKQTSPRRNDLVIKSIIDEPIFHNSGNLRIPKMPGDCTSFYELKDVNYVFLHSTENFDLLINDLVMFNTSQFSFINRNRFITIAIRPSAVQDLFVEFVYGNVDLGDESQAVALTKPTCGAKWDRVLKNIILTRDLTNTAPIVFPQVSHVCTGA